MEDTDIKVVSPYDEDFSADRRPQGAAYNYLACGGDLRSVIDSFSTHPYEDVFPDELDWTLPAVQSLLSKVGDVIDHDFDMVETHGRNEIATTMNLPIIGALNAVIPSLRSDARICVIGADRGQNVTQLEIARGRVNNDFSIDCIEPSTDLVVQKKLKRTMSVYSKSRVLVETLQSAVEKGLFKENGADIQYDLIIHNLGMHVLCASAVDRLIYKDFLLRHLGKNGRALVTSIDAASLRRSDDQGMQAISRTTQVVQDYPPSSQYVEGMLVVRVGNTMFHDPVLSIDAIEEMFHDTDLNCEIAFGKYLFRKNDSTCNNDALRFNVPHHMLGASKRPELSLVIFIEFKWMKRELIDCKLISCDETLLPDSSRWKQVDSFDLNEKMRCHFSVNKGRALVATDLILMGSDDVFVAPKLDGVAGMVSVQRGIALLMVDDGRMYKAVCLSPMYTHDMQLQVEVLDPFEVVVLDPYRIGVKTPFTFFRRWSVFKQIYANSPVLQGLFSCQNYQLYTKNWMDVCVSRVHNGFCDGVVIQPCWARSGCFSDGLGSVRYLKEEYTLDVACVDSKRVLEVKFEPFLKGKIEVVRERKDKTRPNTKAQAEMMAHALKFQDWIDFCALSPKRLQLEDIPVIMSVLAGEKPFSSIPEKEKLTVYRGRHRDYDVVRAILDGLGGTSIDVIYNCYIHVKHLVLRDIVARYVEPCRWDEHDLYHVLPGPYVRIGSIANDQVDLPLE